ncbi:MULTISPECIES: hypothetical protein [Vibrio]|uniref:hypothetical protein n=1 Tax=Vibrio TaxID=662 RepID=UPI00142ECCF6|nr:MULTISPECIES: hypothetical protein [Vibrio]EJL6304704.1 hypothetical protein [Vibrio cholerae]ELJ8527276.1 hypothetical protein [Vibrio cholerae]
MNELSLALARFFNAIMDSINRSRKAAATNSPSEHIANGGSVQHSATSFSDLADEPKRD